MGKNHFPRIDTVNILVLASIFALLILCSRCYTIYPLDDDWSYIRAAEAFYNTGHMKFTPWTSPSLVFQVLWGTFFAAIFGFSINTLILSTLVISFAGMVCFYLLLRDGGWHPQRSIFFTLVIVVNPFSFPLLFTFFTDHHFIGLILIATFFYYRGASSNRLWYILVGSIFASFALLVRQPGILVAAGAALYFLMCERPWPRAMLKIFLTGFIPTLALIIYSYWFQNIHGATFSSVQQWEWIAESLQNPSYILSKIINRPFRILEFFGFSLIPCSVALLPAPSELLQRRQSALVLTFCLAGVLFYLINDHVGVASTIYNWMNGFQFAYVSEYGYRGAKNVLLLFYKVFDFLSIFSITLLMVRAVKGRKAIKAAIIASPLLMLVLIGLLQLLFLIIVRYKFPRYYLTILPFFMVPVFAALRDSALQKKYFFPLLAGFLLFSVMGTQDFLCWNETRWKLGNRLIQKGMSTLKISGGFPWDCWHNMEYSLRHPYEILPRKYDIPWWIEDLTPAIDPEYLIANSPVPSGFYYLRYFCTDRYVVEDTVDYYSLLYLKKMKIYLLKRLNKAGHMEGREIIFNFLDNIRGARINSKTSETVKQLNTISITLDDQQQRALLQPANTAATFRLSIPHQHCRLSFDLGTLPETWGQQGDGVLYKVLLSDNLMENLFDEPGMVGVEQRLTFLKPRSWFFKFRTIYLHYLDPKHNPAERIWQHVTLDLTQFAGKMVDITFEVDPGPKKDSSYDVALWGEPVIELY